MLATAHINVGVRRFVPALSPSTFQTELDNAYVNETYTLDPNRTALVLIDVWDDAYSPELSENEQLRLIPLLGLARASGFLIVHAPSENSEWRNITVLPGEILVKGENGTSGSSAKKSGNAISPPPHPQPYV